MRVEKQSLIGKGLPKTVVCFDISGRQGYRLPICLGRVLPVARQCGLDRSLRRASESDLACVEVSDSHVSCSQCQVGDRTCADV